MTPISIALMVAVLVVMPVETLLSWKFNRFYFTVGVPLFKTERDRGATANPIPSAGQLQALMPRAFNKVAFSQIGPAQIAFREPLWKFAHFGYIPTMHGLASFDLLTGQVRVVGLANWFPLLLMAFLVTHSLTRQESAPLAVFFAVFFLLFYAIQFQRFRKIAALTVSCWSMPVQSANTRRPP